MLVAGMVLLSFSMFSLGFLCGIDAVPFNECPCREYETTSDEDLYDAVNEMPGEKDEMQN